MHYVLESETGEGGSIKEFEAPDDDAARVKAGDVHGWVGSSFARIWRKEEWDSADPGRANPICSSEGGGRWEESEGEWLRRTAAAGGTGGLSRVWYVENGICRAGKE